jgi:hypothetical protein
MINTKHITNRASDKHITNKASDKPCNTHEIKLTSSRDPKFKHDAAKRAISLIQTSIDKIKEKGIKALEVIAQCSQLHQTIFKQLEANPPDVKSNVVYDAKIIFENAKQCLRELPLSEEEIKDLTTAIIELNIHSNSTYSSKTSAANNFESELETLTMALEPLLKGYGHPIGPVGPIGRFIENELKKLPDNEKVALYSMLSLKDNLYDSESPKHLLLIKQKLIVIPGDLLKQHVANYFKVLHEKEHMFVRNYSLNKQHFSIGSKGELVKMTKPFFDFSKYDPTAGKFGSGSGTIQKLYQLASTNDQKGKDLQNILNSMFYKNYNKGWIDGGGVRFFPKETYEIMSQHLDHDQKKALEEFNSLHKVESIIKNAADNDEINKALSILNSQLGSELTTSDLLTAIDLVKNQIENDASDNKVQEKEVGGLMYQVLNVCMNRFQLTDKIEKKILF